MSPKSVTVGRCQAALQLRIRWSRRELCLTSPAQNKRIVAPVPITTDQYLISLKGTLRRRQRVKLTWRVRASIEGECATCHGSL
jgi:hypothetical protein